jgi:type IV secretory pathway VirB10-like protein
MSLRPPPPPPPPADPDPPVVAEEPEPEPEDPDDEDDEDDDVEYFVDVEAVSWVRTSVPKSAQSPQTSSSAPSILTVFGDPVSVPHISHWTGPLPVMFSPE